MAQSKAKKNAKARQSRRNKQYNQLIRDFKLKFNELQFGAILGTAAPSAEDLLRQVGTKSGLKSPTKKTIENLRRLNKRSDILREALKAVEKKVGKESPEYAVIKERFESEWNVEQARRKRNKDRPNKPPKPPTPGSNKQDDEIPVDTAAIEVVLQQLQIIVDRINSKKYVHGADARVIYCAEEIAEKINYFLGTGTDYQIFLLNEGAKKYFSTIRQIEYQELYENAPFLRPCLFDELDKTLSQGDRRFWDQQNAQSLAMTDYNDFSNGDWFQ